MLSKKHILIIVITLLITLGLNFIITPVSYCAKDEFYYIGQTGASYTVDEGAVSKIRGALEQIGDYVLQLLFFGGRVVIVGWIALFEWLLVITIDVLCSTNLSEMTETVTDENGESKDQISAISVFESIHNVKNRVTFEKIIFSQIDLFNANIFDFEGKNSNSTSGATP